MDIAEPSKKQKTIFAIIDVNTNAFDISKFHEREYFSVCFVISNESSFCEHMFWFVGRGNDRKSGAAQRFKHLSQLIQKTNNYINPCAKADIELQYSPNTLLTLLI